MNSKLALVLVLALGVGPFTTGCAISAKADGWSGGGIPNVVAAGQDTSSERSVAPHVPVAFERDDREGSPEPRPVPLHEATICARCSR